MPDRAYKIMFRIWPGSHRLLLWGDPSSAASYSRALRFCGSDGVELLEPLSFKGRRGSGIPGSRCAYADTSLIPRWDWQKYLYTYRTWGRLMYNPEAQPDVWRRYLQKQVGAAAPDLETALGRASGITPLITTADLPSAANEVFNPEYYTNQPIVDASKPTPYFDTPAPKVFGNVSPLDPQLFSTIHEFVGELLKKERSAKYSPIEVAEWLDAATDSADLHLSQLEAHAADRSSPEFQRTVVDLKVQIGIGRFFAAKFRSGVLYAAFEQTGDRNALEEALKQYRRARKIWQSFAEEATGIYLSDITFGPSPFQRGNWLDRLPAIDEDIAEMQKHLEAASAGGEQRNSVPLSELTVPTKRESVDVQHTPAGTFVPGQPLDIAISVPQNAAQSMALRIYYRHVNQAERYQSIEMVVSDNRFRGDDSRELHELAISAAVLLRAAAFTRKRVALSWTGRQSAKRALFRCPSRIRDLSDRRAAICHQSRDGHPCVCKSQPQTINMKFTGANLAKSGKVVMLSARGTQAANTIEAPETIVPKEGALRDVSVVVHYTAPAYSIQVLELKKQ